MGAASTGWHGLISAVNGENLDPKGRMNIGFAQMKRSLSGPRYWPCRNPCPDSLGVKMRLARYAAGMTQRELAAHFGVTRETINRIECGRRGDYSTKHGVCLLRERMRIWAEMNKPAGREATVASIEAGGCFF